MTQFSADYIAAILLEPLRSPCQQSSAEAQSSSTIALRVRLAQRPTQASVLLPASILLVRPLQTLPTPVLPPLIRRAQELLLLQTLPARRMPLLRLR